jgi:hypothetical protein
MRTHRFQALKHLRRNLGLSGFTAAIERRVRRPLTSLSAHLTPGVGHREHQSNGKGVCFWTWAAARNLRTDSLSRIGTSYFTKPTGVNNMKRPIRCVATAVALALTAGVSIAGPVILGGDDLTDHGNRTGGTDIAGQNNEGWLYIEKAVSNVLGSQTRAGTLTHDIIALGAADSTDLSGNAGAGIHFAALELGKTVLYVDGAAAINQFFANLANGTVNPGMLWFAGTGAANDLDDAEGLALTNNAAAINTFGASGGGIMAHGSGANAYGWLSALLPGINFDGDCNSTNATLTLAGQAAFPGLSNNDINRMAGPCHNSFSGAFGGLQTLGLDGNQRSFIIGGGAGTVIQCGVGDQPPCPTVPEPGTIPLMMLAALGLALPGLRRRFAKPA